MGYFVDSHIAAGFPLGILAVVFSSKSGPQGGEASS